MSPNALDLARGVSQGMVLNPSSLPDKIREAKASNTCRIGVYDNDDNESKASLLFSLSREDRQRYERRPPRSILKFPQVSDSIPNDQMKEKLEESDKCVEAIREINNISEELSSYLEGYSIDEIYKMLKLSRTCATDNCIFKPQELVTPKSKLQELPAPEPKPMEIATPEPKPRRPQTPHVRRKIMDASTPQEYHPRPINSTECRPETLMMETSRYSTRERSYHKPLDINLSPIVRKKLKKPVYRPAYEVLRNDCTSNSMEKCMKYFREMFVATPKEKYNNIKTSTPDKRRSKHRDYHIIRESTPCNLPIREKLPTVCSKSCKAHCNPNFLL